MLSLKAIAETLQEHCLGRERGRSVAALAVMLGLNTDDSSYRQIRSAVKTLRMRGAPICAHPSAGYYWAETAAELVFTITFLRGRALSSLMQISKLQRHLQEEDVGQLILDLLVEEPEDYLQPFIGPSRAYQFDVCDQLLSRLETLVLDRADLSMTDAINLAISNFLVLEEDYEQ